MVLHASEDRLERADGIGDVRGVRPAVLVKRELLWQWTKEIMPHPDRAAGSLRRKRPRVREEKDCVGGHEILPFGGHETARWWLTVLPTDDQWFCPR